MSAQHLTNTAPNRYPEVFRTLRARVEQVRGADLGQGDLRILSFGCSVGFEMKTLRAYFPDASIFGCDTSSEALHRARRNLREDAGVVFYSTPQAIDAFGPFDIILAMSVLCQFPASTRLEDLTPLFPFRTFEMLTASLTRNLRPGGLFCLVNANYLFSALDAARQFRPVRSPLIHSNGFVDKFAADGGRLTRIFRHKALSSHRPVGPGLLDADLRDCIFEKFTTDTKPLDVAFLQADAPPGVAFGAPIVAEGMDAEAAAREGTIAAHREEAFGSDSKGRQWMRAQWCKATLAATVTGFGPWYGIVGPERARRLELAQEGVLAETDMRSTRAAILRERVLTWLPWTR
jgi:SAM-dependent methyltransferase